MAKEKTEDVRSNKPRPGFARVKFLKDYDTPAYLAKSGAEYEIDISLAKDLDKKGICEIKALPEASKLDLEARIERLEKHVFK